MPTNGAASASKPRPSPKSSYAGRILERLNARPAGRGTLKTAKAVAATFNTNNNHYEHNHAILGSQESLDATCENYNEALLHKAVEDAGRWAYGIIVAEVWCISDDQTKLFRPNGGYWFDPTYHEECVGDDCQICRLFYPEHHDYAEPKHVAPGEGLPGALWADVSVGNWSKNHRESLASSIMNSSTNDKEFRHEITLAHFRTRHIVWRNVQQLHDDPDQPWNLRLKLLAEFGLGWAAAVPFSMHGSRGIVIFMARDSVDMSRLQSEQNEVYLRAATDLIGAASAFGAPRKAAVMERRKELLTTLHRVRDKILAIHRDGISLKAFVDDQAKLHVSPKGRRRMRHVGLLADAGRGAQKRANMVLEKAKGAGVPIPPAFGWAESCFTFICVLITMTTLTFLHKYIRNDAGDDYAVAIGPNGALMCLLFGLTAAPASQPRNAIVGQAVSMTISLSVASSEAIPIWLRQGLATALSVAVMAKLGVTHPPAAASAAIFASGLVNWPSMGFLLVANVIAVLLSTSLNNLSTKRQYPTYWGAESLWADLESGLKAIQSACHIFGCCLKPLPGYKKKYTLPKDTSISGRSKVAPDATTSPERADMETSVGLNGQSNPPVDIALDP
ncbi:hypothetical protein MPSEU_000598800 [Mayamaea pseudoterrestris]|nr:hypothetical protein MPSEU_000598800 [Mayamaea pseudoterrestris]